MQSGPEDQSGIKRTFSQPKIVSRRITYRNAEFPVSRLVFMGTFVAALMATCAIGIHNRHGILASDVFGSVTRNYIESATGLRSVNFTLTHGVVIVDSVDPLSDEFLVYVRRKNGGSAGYPVRNGKSSIPLSYGTTDNVITAMALTKGSAGKEEGLVWTPVDFSDAMKLTESEGIQFAFTLSLPRP